MKKYTQAPLPFVGQKRMFLKHFENVINEIIDNDGDGWSIIDAFGGSGLLSHNAKQLKPNARVIYNDFDDYAQRLKHIDDINALRRILAEIINDAPRQKRLSDSTKHNILTAIGNFKGYKDPHILCAWLLFSGQQISNIDELKNKSFYNCLRQSDYPTADGYLDGVEVVKQSFHQLLPQYQHDKKALFILDPPYLCTRQESYKQVNYFDLIDFLRLINLTRPPYLFFSSTKSEFIRFIDYTLESKTNNYQTFENAKVISINATTSNTGSYEDNLVYKHFTTTTR